MASGQCVPGTMVCSTPHALLCRTRGWRLGLGRRPEPRALGLPQGRLKCQQSRPSGPGCGRSALAAAPSARRVVRAAAVAGEGGNNGGGASRAWEEWNDLPGLPMIESGAGDNGVGAGAGAVDGRGGLAGEDGGGTLAQALRGDTEWVVEEELAVEPGGVPAAERAFLVGVQVKAPTRQRASGYSVGESLHELARLADTAGLQVVGQTQQQLETPSPRTYIGSGKVEEVAAAVAEAGAETCIFDDELSPGQLRNLERALGDRVRICDRTALILDIFSQRAATREGQLQVELAQCDYQLPRLTRMWTHLERQAGGRVRGMGEKQIEVDKRLLRTRIAQLRRSLQDVRRNRQQYRDRRAQVHMPVIALVGYTNAGKSTLLNTLTGAGVLAEDKLFATLDPTTRRVAMPGGKEVLFTDTVGFIQKLPTQLIAAFRATLEEIKEASLLVHVVDVSSPAAAAQAEAVEKVLKELEAGDLPMITLWNKVDATADPAGVRMAAAPRPSTFCVSAATGDGVPEFLEEVERRLADLLHPVRVLLPFSQGELLAEIHKTGVIQREAYCVEGTLVAARVPPPLATRLALHALDDFEFGEYTAEAVDADGSLLPA